MFSHMLVWRPKFWWACWALASCLLTFFFDAFLLICNLFTWLVSFVTQYKIQDTRRRIAFLFLRFARSGFLSTCFTCATCLLCQPMEATRCWHVSFMLTSRVPLVSFITQCKIRGVAMLFCLVQVFDLFCSSSDIMCPTLHFSFAYSHFFIYFACFTCTTCFARYPIWDPRRSISFLLRSHVHVWLVSFVTQYKIRDVAFYFLPTLRAWLVSFAIHYKERDVAIHFHLHRLRDCSRLALTIR